MSQLRRYYDTLGLRAGAPFREVRHAYLGLVRQWHPDRFASDPPRQRLAQERLKTINEAYRALEEALSGERERTVAAPSPPQQAESPAEPAVSGEKGKKETGGLVRFLSFWPNVLFLGYLLFAGRMAAARGDLLYFVQMAAIPALFALLCNSRLGARQSLWKAYVATICIFSVLLAADASMTRRGVRDAWSPRFPDSGETVAPGVTAPPGVPAFSGRFSEEPDRKGPGGVRQVTPPTPPTAPEAPESPSAPVAPVVPGGR